MLAEISSAKQFSNLDAVMAANKRATENLKPPPEMLPSVWAEKNVSISVGNAIPGPINFDNAPPQRGMLNVIKEPGVRRVDYMCAAQTGKTTVQQCITGYFIAHEPRSQIFAQPSQGDMQTFLETKLRPMLELNPAISRRMAKQRGREGVNNSRIISYIGGWLMFSWAGSPKTARGRSAPVTQADEVDGMPPTPEGDFVELLSQRSATFGDQRLDVRSSTPTIKGKSRIETGFNEGDQRRYFVACPHCGFVQFLRWENIHWTGRASMGVKDYEEDVGKDHDPNSARYRCADPECSVLWDDGERIAAIRNAEGLGYGWKATKPFKGHASFHAPEFLSTFRRLREIVQSYLDKLAMGDMQSFVNVSLAEAYEETGEKADPDGLLARCVVYGAQVPYNVLCLTAGIDMQQDRLEVEIVGWGLGEQSWGIEYHVLWGDPLMPDVWEDLEDLLAAPYVHETGVNMPITSACLDTGGTAKQGASYTQAAYTFLAGKTGRRLFGIKGIGGWGRPIVEKGLKKQSGKKARKVDLFLVGADEAKLITMRRLALDKPGPGYCNFPDTYDKTYFDGLTSENLITRYVKGFAVREWHKPDRARNEPLDCRCYALAALKIVNPSFKRLAERLGIKAPAIPAAALSAAPAAEPARLPAPPADMKRPPKPPRERAPPPAPAPVEKTHEEPKPVKPETTVIKRPKRQNGQRRGGWVGNW